MKVCAVTMVYKDHWYLSKWIEYYGRLLGTQNLYVIGHGDDDVHAELAKDCNLIRIPRNQLPEDFDEQRWRMLTDFCAVLLNSHDWVLCGDVDEIVLPTQPDQTLLQILDNQRSQSVVGAVGFEVEPLTDDRLQLRFSARYSKPFALSEPITFSLGAHGAFHPWAHTPGLALIHFPLANRTSMQQRSDALEADFEELRNAPMQDRSYRHNALLKWGDVQRRKANTTAEVHDSDNPVPLSEAVLQAVPHLASSMRVVEGKEYRVAPRRLRNINILAEMDDRLTTLFS
ncbi:glycosyltransferase family 2 protein [Ruegeria arenilitoris]|uniref:glycosyltransferase family 2 protein n=1 Tax=Ruegeria arenilitoris TaxID=1173585 RepID=UPI00147C31EC|nr:glycosyltransferase family 2 protein [Ruegeria arenilitoris]